MVDTKKVVALATSALVVIIILAVAPMIGSTIDAIDSTQDDTTATVTVTFGAGSLVTETLNLSTETYTVTADGVGQWNFDNGSAATVSASLTSEINTNSTLFTAVDGTGSVVITTILKGTEMNAYGCTTNVTGASCSAATFLGALDGDAWSPDTTTNLATPAQTWATFVGLIILSFLAVIIGLAVREFKKIGGD